MSEIEGRIPLASEVVLLEPIGLRMEVVASTDRRVERLRVFPPVGHANGRRDRNFPSRSLTETIQAPRIYRLAGRRRLPRPLTRMLLCGSRRPRSKIAMLL